MAGSNPVFAYPTGDVIMKKFVVVLISVVLSGLIIITGGLFVKRLSSDFENEKMNTETYLPIYATVVDVNDYVVYSYTFKDTIYEARARSTLNTQVGDTMLVLVNPDNPTEVVKYSGEYSVFYFIERCVLFPALCVSYGVGFLIAVAQCALNK